MATGQVQLSASAQAVADAAGSATITFPPVRLNRTWQGSVSVSGTPRGTAFTVLVGGQPLGTLFSPGPFGPVQVLSSQSLQVICTGLLVSGNNYIANISGVDDPSSNATPYSGPVAVTISNDQGGLLYATKSVSQSGTPGKVLPAPPAGTAYRIQSITVAGSGTAQDTIGLYLQTPVGQQFTFFLTTLSVTGTIGTSSLLNGQLIAGEIDFLYYGAVGSSYGVTVFFDLVAI